MLASSFANEGTQDYQKSGNQEIRRPDKCILLEWPTPDAWNRGLRKYRKNLDIGKLGNWKMEASGVRSRLLLESPMLKSEIGNREKTGHRPCIKFERSMPNGWFLRILVNREGFQSDGVDWISPFIRWPGKSRTPQHHLSISKGLGNRELGISKKLENRPIDMRLLFFSEAQSPKPDF